MLCSVHGHFVAQSKPSVKSDPYGTKRNQLGENLDPCHDNSRSNSGTAWPSAKSRWKCSKPQTQSKLAEASPKAPVLAFSWSGQSLMRCFVRSEERRAGKEGRASC